mgnify:CR=1 FL=1
MQIVAVLSLLWSTAMAGPTGNEEVDQWIGAERQGRHASASAGLAAVLHEGNYPELDPVVNYHLGKALLSMGLEHSAQNHFLETVRAGPGAEHFRVAVTHLIALSEHTGNDAELLRFVGKIDAELFPRQAQDHLYYLQGRKLYERHELSAATEAFQRVRGTSVVANRARFHAGVIFNEQLRLGQAMKAFKEVSAKPLRAQYRQDDANLQSLALMNMARIRYGLGQYERAADLYTKVPQESTYWADSMFELAWASYRGEAQDIPRTLGILLALESPHFSDEYQPEVPLLRSLSLYSLCHWQSVDETLALYESEWTGVISEIDGLMLDYPPDQRNLLADQFYDDVVEAGKLDSQPQLLRRLLRNRDLRARVQTLDRLEAETVAIEAQKQVWQVELGHSLVDQIQRDRIRYKRAAGKLLMRELLGERDSLAELMIQSATIRFETVDEQRRELDHRITHAEVAPFKAMAIDYGVNQQLVNWPFNGEFWWDELPYYRYVLQPRCGLDDI